MTSSFNAFQTIMQDTWNSSVLYSYLTKVVRPPYDYSDILRWQWAQSVSTLDKLIHDLVRIGMLEIFQGQRLITNKYLNFQISIQTHEKMIQNSQLSCSFLEQEIAHKNSFLSFQDLEKIANALAYIWTEPHKWSVLASRLGMIESDVRIQLKNIVIRRNQIVHEGDYSSYLLQHQPIAESDVKDVLNFISNLGKVIYNEVK